VAKQKEAMLWVTLSLGLFSTLVPVVFWQAKRWSDAKPSLDFSIAGGETSHGQRFGIEIQNRGSLPVHHPAIFVSWQDSNLWKTARLTIHATQYVPLRLLPLVQEVEVDKPRIWIDYCDEFGRLYRVQRHLVQRWDTRHHKFFLEEQAGSRTVNRPRWMTDLFRWRKVYS
jgi:hypothetical protein